MKKQKIDVEDLEYEIALAPLEQQRKLFWELVKRYPRWKNELLEFYIAWETDGL